MFQHDFIKDWWNKIQGDRGLVRKSTWRGRFSWLATLKVGLSKTKKKQGISWYMRKLTWGISFRATAPQSSFRKGKTKKHFFDFRGECFRRISAMYHFCFGHKVPNKQYYRYVSKFRNCTTFFEASGPQGYFFKKIVLLISLWGSCIPNIRSLPFLYDPIRLLSNYRNP